MGEDPTPCRIVICDDQDGFRRALATVLGLEGDFEVVGEAANGRAAIAAVAELRPDVLLLDVAMPVMDGLEALPRIRDEWPDTQVVMLSGITAASVRERALDGGACRFVEKGIDVVELVGEIREVCSGRG